MTSALSHESSPPLDPYSDLATLTRALCDIPSVSGDEKIIADAVERTLNGLDYLEVLRNGDAVVARTQQDRGSRIVIAGHLDTVPVAGNLPSWSVVEGGSEVIHGRGAVDMKASLAIMLRLAATLRNPRVDITYVFYDNEEVASHRNGLGRLARERPEWLMADFAVLGEPSNETVEGGCQGTMRASITVAGVAAHSARSWTGRNAIHGAGAVLDVLNDYQPRVVTVDGLEYREGLNAVNIEGGIAGNVVPDRCVINVNFRFAPDRDVAAAKKHLHEVFDGFDIEVTDAAPGARPGLTHPVAAEFVAAVGRPAAAKFGWTDVARFTELGIPAVNFGPGDPQVAHSDTEYCSVSAMQECERVLRAWLAAPIPAE